jgi:hypothetical protein
MLSPSKHGGAGPTDILRQAQDDNALIGINEMI